MIKKLFLNIIKIYQVTPFHMHSFCRFKPTCSEYTYEAINEYGVLKGTYLGIKRIIKCNPFGKYGYDPLKKEGK